MKICIAPDSFKGSLTSLQAAECIEKGMKRGMKGLSFVKVPMADGGEGTVQAVIDATGGRLINKVVTDPLGRRVKAGFGVSGDGKTAVIEMAAASGLMLLKPSERNPMVTTTRGTGELIKAALDLGVKRILVGIGGSATNDGGAGMARALGARFLDRRSEELLEGGGSLKMLAGIDMSGFDSRIRDVHIEVACDVTNPLCGPKGASCVYGPQKGASPVMVRELDNGLKNLAEVIFDYLGIRIARIPGAGAAGGLGAGLIAFCGARLKEGVELVADIVKLDSKVSGCDLVVTGEGRMDGQTVYGKTPAGVAKAAKRNGKPVIAICGSAGDGVENVYSAGIDAYFTALREPLSEKDLRCKGPALLEACACEVARLIGVGIRLKQDHR